MPENNDILGGLTGLIGGGDKKEGGLSSPSSDAKSGKGIVESLGNTVDGVAGTDGLVGGLGGTVDGIAKGVGLEDEKGDLDLSSITKMISK